ncbi:MAG: FAD-binding oxidoreductase [Halobacteriales archaeon]
MDVRQHLSQHETATRLPLLTESATVTDVTAMDKSRNDAVLRTIRRTLDRSASVAWQRERPEDDAACRRWIRDHLDSIEWGTPLNQYLTEREKEGRIGHKLAALQERYLRPYPSLLTVTVETDKPVEFVAGQYISIRYRGTTRPYSVANSPTTGDIEFCIRRVSGGQLTSELAESLSVGDTVTLRGPYGDFVMEPPSHRDLVFLATGTGVAPFRSMIDYCFEMGRDSHHGEKRDIWLFLGAAWADDLPYREHFRSLAQDHEHFHFVPTVSRERYLGNWTGETDYVQHILVKYFEDSAFESVELPKEFARYRNEQPREEIDVRIDPDSVEVYACGINAMVYGLVDAVQRLGVPDRHTQFEGFG